MIYYVYWSSWNTLMDLKYSIPHETNQSNLDVCPYLL